MKITKGYLNIASVPKWLVVLNYCIFESSINNYKTKDLSANSIKMTKM